MARGGTEHRILVVDDAASVRNALVALFESDGYDARGVENGRAALQLLRDGFHASVVLLDMLMPDMDGWDFRLEQQADPMLADIPVVLLTAVVNPELEADKLGAIAGFRKPLDIYALLEVVSDVCAGSHIGHRQRIAPRRSGTRGRRTR